MARRVSISPMENLYPDDDGDHVILSIEDYNKIVRSLNLLTMLVMEHEPKPINNNLIDVLIKQKLPIIEDE